MEAWESTYSIQDHSHWCHIKCVSFYLQFINVGIGYRAENSFNDTLPRMIAGVDYGHSKPQDLPIWNTRSICQRLDDFEDPVQFRGQ